MDALDVKKSMYGKKAAVVGVATGRAGNLRGIDHLTSVLAHMQIAVLPKFLPVSSVEKELDENGKLKNEKTKLAFRNHVESFLSF
jgi:NAD(P)H-dependent FMN reductase